MKQNPQMDELDLTKMCLKAFIENHETYTNVTELNWIDQFHRLLEPMKRNFMEGQTTWTKYQSKLYIGKTLIKDVVEKKTTLKSVKTEKMQSIRNICYTTKA
ncbi:hypothetical protein WA026_022255 [Henosepilachna vigintioctopunctata]|uniref:Uncharacterized protein n=1 Tax=Henosepilachna vigintioctopunctata TaxID=420089 RepID=A0AAW1UIU2_9CUCU